MQVTDVVITGATGFLGAHLTRAAAAMCPAAHTVAISSPRSGGIDLTSPRGAELIDQHVHLRCPETTLVIHAAAAIEWNTLDGLLKNAIMAHSVAAWAKSKGVGFSVLVSSVSVYPHSPLSNVSTPTNPQSFYGAGKVAAEQIWRLVLPAERSAVLRLAGIWGWQPHPTLFWNRLLRAAACGHAATGEPIVRRRHSRRNYISAREASTCLMQIGLNRLPGLYLGAGKEPIDTKQFVQALEKLPNSRLQVVWQDDGGADEEIYTHSRELDSWLAPFADELTTTWANAPAWAFT